MPISHRLFAVAFQQNMPALENIDIETQDALVKLCNPESQIKCLHCWGSMLVSSVTMSDGCGVILPN
jgi:hypothetical protein